MTRGEGKHRMQVARCPAVSDLCPAIVVAALTALPGAAQRQAAYLLRLLRVAQAHLLAQPAREATATQWLAEMRSAQLVTPQGPAAGRQAHAVASAQHQTATSSAGPARAEPDPAAAASRTNGKREQHKSESADDTTAEGTEDSSAVAAVVAVTLEAARRWFCGVQLLVHHP